jgi:hypothetical protein
MTKIYAVVGVCVVLSTAGFVAGLLVERLILAKRAPSVDQAEVVKANPETPNPLKVGVFLQTGEINPFDRDLTFDVFYQQPYASPPELKVIDWGPIIEPTIVEQWPHGFRIRAASRVSMDNGKRGRYEARGIPGK